MQIKTDDQLDIAIARIGELLKLWKLTPEENKELEEISDAVWEYEERTDILNRNYRIV